MMTMNNIVMQKRGEKMKKIKKRIEKITKKIKNTFSKKVPIYCPLLEGELLKNKVALITGGSSGIGYSIAESFLKNGASVIIVGRNQEKLLEAVENLKKHCKEQQFIKQYVLDISDVANIKTKVDGILNDNNVKIDILVNNAWISRGRQIGNTKIEYFESVISTNLEGTFFISQEIFNYMRKNNIKGNILNVASSSSIRPAVTAYALSKWSIVGLTKGLAKKAIKYGIVVNAIAPGPTATPMLVEDASVLDLDTSPAGRYILPEEIGNLSTVLVSDMGRMIVGETLFVTGGAGVITYDDIKY